MEPVEAVFERMVAELAEKAGQRYLTAVHREDMSHEEAMQEVVRTILEAYRDALAS